jgi:hypothetical protein
MNSTEVNRAARELAEAREANRQSRNAEYERVCPPPADQESHVEWESNFISMQTRYALRDVIEARDAFLARSRWESLRPQVRTLYGKFAAALGPVIGEAQAAQKVAQEAFQNEMNERAVA